MKKFLSSALFVMLFVAIGCGAQATEEPMTAMAAASVEAPQPVTTPLFLNTDGVRESLIFHILAAQESIEIGTMGFTSEEFAEMLIEKLEVNSDFQISIMTPARSETSQYSKTGLLEEAGVVIKVIGGKNLYHEKWAIFDGKVAMIFSSNITERGLFYNYEIGVIFPDSPDIVQALRDHANAIWEGGYVPADPFEDLEPGSEPAEEDE